MYYVLLLKSHKINYVQPYTRRAMENKNKTKKRDEKVECNKN